MRTLLPLLMVLGATGCSSGAVGPSGTLRAYCAAAEARDGVAIRSLLSPQARIGVDDALLQPYLDGHAAELLLESLALEAALGDQGALVQRATVTLGPARRVVLGIGEDGRWRIVSGLP